MSDDDFDYTPPPPKVVRTLLCEDKPVAEAKAARMAELEAENARLRKRVKLRTDALTLVHKGLQSGHIEDQTILRGAKATPLSRIVAAALKEG